MTSHVISSHWGAGIAETLDGRLLSVTGHPADADPSRINENYVDSINGKARVRRPAIRKGYLENGPVRGVNRRGEEPFVEVSWEVALDLAARALEATRKTHGNEAIFGGSYGWASAGRFHHAQSQLKRFLNCAGGFVRSEGNYSYTAALVLMPHIVGNFREHVKQATRWSVVAKSGELVVMFGGVPIRSGQITGGGMARHRLRDGLLACRKAGVEFINLSPLETDALQDLEAEWLAPRPGSDTAIMLGLAHTLLVENLYDQDFLDRYTVGFDKVAAYLRGTPDGVPKDAAWASIQSGIPAEKIQALARRMAAARTLICTTAGLQRAEHGEQPLWMTVTLAAMLGQIGLPGGGYGIGYGADGSIGTNNAPVAWPSLPQGRNAVAAFIPVAAISDMLLNPGGQYDYDGTRMTFPDIRLVWWVGGNPFHHHQDLNKLLKAFQQPETIIVNEINWTATARHADIVFPVTSALERVDFGGGSQDNALIPMPRIVDPVGDARDEYDIFTAIAARLGFQQAFTEGRTSRDWLERMWVDMRQTAAAVGRTLPDFDAFLEGDIIEFEDPAPNAVFLADFRADPDKNRLPTPSGKIELYSEVIAGYHYDDCPGQATWLPPSEWLRADLAATYPLHLISGQPETRLHSQLDPGSFSQSRKIKGREPVLINPKDAAARGIADGDVVVVFNGRGRCLAGAVVTDKIRENVIFLWTGAWYDPDQRGHVGALDKHGNPNVLTHDRRTSRLAQGPAAHSTLVEVKRFEGELPAVTAYDAPVEKAQERPKSVQHGRR